MDTFRKPLTWGRCAWIVGLTMFGGMGLSLWWPVWLMPPHFSDTKAVYLALSQLWLAAFLLCALFRPAPDGWQAALKLFAAACPFSAGLLWLQLAFVWSAWLNRISGIGNLVYVAFAVITGVMCAALPLYVLRRWFRLGNQIPFRQLAQHVGVGLVIAVVFTCAIQPNVGLASGGLFVAPLTCAKPTMAQVQIRYTCREEGAFASLQTYSLEGWQGFPFGQLKSHPGNDNIGG